MNAPGSISRVLHAHVHLGVDSRAAMEMRQSLATNLGVTLPVTLLYDHQTVSEIAGFVCKQLVEAEEAAAAGCSEVLALNASYMGGAADELLVGDTTTTGTATAGGQVASRLPCSRCCAQLQPLDPCSLQHQALQTLR